MPFLKPFTLSLFVIAISSASFGYVSKTYSALNGPKKQTVPPGTVKISENFFFDQTEITNFSWLEYVFWNKNMFGDGSNEHIASLPDTMVWGDNSPYVKYYFNHPSYQNYPVLGVSHEQAIAYCNWRSDRVNEMIFAKKNKVLYHYYKVDSNFAEIPTIFQYRLPSEEEWERVANAPFSKKALRQQKKQQPYNLQHERDDISMDVDGSDITAPAESYWPNIYGVYNIIGNVAEMVNKKGIAKGGSWRNKPNELKVSENINYSKPTNWLGFRCVCERVD